MPNEIDLVPDLYRLAYVPGAWHCDKCGFELTKTTLCVASGNTGTTEADRQSEQCPNDGTWMRPVTYREAVAAFEKRCFEEIERANNAEAELLTLRQESASAERRGIEQALEAVIGAYSQDLPETREIGFVEAIAKITALLPSADETEPTK